MEKTSAWYKADERSAWPLWLYAAVFAYAAFLFVPQVFNDGDTYLHVALGEWMLNHGEVIHADHFSLVFDGKPWVSHEWLSEILMALAYRLEGWNGVAILFGCTTALTSALLARHLAQWLNPLAIVITLVIVAACISPSLLARPHIFILPVMELWAAGLLIARSQNKAPSPRLLLLMTLWANLHGSFLFGIALIAPFALEAMIAAGKAWQKSMCSWGMFGFGAVAAALLTPHGWQGLMLPIVMLRLKELNIISEWRSVDFSTVQPIELAFVTVVYICLTRGFRIPAVRVLILLGLLHQALQHIRFESQAALVGSLVLAEPLGQELGLPVRLADRANVRQTLPRLLVFVTLAFLLALLRITHPIPLKRGDTITAPVSAVDHVPKSLRDKPVLNEDAFGSYLIFRGIRPYLDGRIDLYGDEFMSDYIDMTSPNVERLKRTLEKWNIEWVIMATGTPIIAVMDMLPEWHRLYSDDTAIVYTRTKP